MQDAWREMLRFREKKIYLAYGPTDMRKEINGLATIVELSFKLDPFGEAVFVFRNRNLDRLKILEWDGDGFWLHLKRLEKGRFKWPSKDKDNTMSLSGEELEHFLEGTKLVRKLLRQEAIGRASV
jgi:transposase